MMPEPNANVEAMAIRRISPTDTPRCMLMPLQTPANQRPYCGRINGMRAGLIGADSCGSRLARQ